MVYFNRYIKNDDWDKIRSYCISKQIEFDVSFGTEKNITIFSFYLDSKKAKDLNSFIDKTGIDAFMRHNKLNKINQPIKESFINKILKKFKMKK